MCVCVGVWVGVCSPNLFLTLSRPVQCTLKSGYNYYICTYVITTLHTSQESEEMKSNSLGIRLKKTEDELRQNEKEKADHLRVSQ